MNQNTGSTQNQLRHISRHFQFQCGLLLEVLHPRNMNPSTDKLVRRTTMVATITASYFLLTADYGPEPNALDPIKNAIKSAEQSVKNFIVGPKNGSQEGEPGLKSPSNTKEKSP